LSGMQDGGSISRVLISGSNTESVEDISLSFRSFLPDWKILTADDNKHCLSLVKRDGRMR
jgi:hypothetical protein